MTYNDVVEIVGGFPPEYAAEMLSAKIHETGEAINEIQHSLVELYKGSENEVVCNAVAELARPRIDTLNRQLKTLKKLLSGFTPDEELDIEAARSRDIFEIASMLGIRYKMRGARGVALCPFHLEKTPSFTLYPDNNFHCFGCGVHGDVIDLYMRLAKVSFKQAVRDLT